MDSSRTQPRKELKELTEAAAAAASWRKRVLRIFIGVLGSIILLLWKKNYVVSDLSLGVGLVFFFFTAYHFVRSLEVSMNVLLMSKDVEFNDVCWRVVQASQAHPASVPTDVAYMGLLYGKSIVPMSIWGTEEERRDSTEKIDEFLKLHDAYVAAGHTAVMPRRLE